MKPSQAHRLHTRALARESGFPAEALDRCASVIADAIVTLARAGIAADPGGLTRPAAPPVPDELPAGWLDVALLYFGPAVGLTRSLVETLASRRWTETAADREARQVEDLGAAIDSGRAGRPPD